MVLQNSTASTKTDVALYDKLKFNGGFMWGVAPRPTSLLKKAGRKLLQHWYVQTSRHFEPRTAHAEKRERALFVFGVARGIYVLRALARRTKMTRITPYNEVFADVIVPKKFFFPKKF